jgi:phage terminase large subunit-like protein
MEEIAVDPYNALFLNQRLTDAGLNTVEVRQGMKSLSPPTKECERWILSGILHHGNNEVLSWMFSNVMIVTDLNDNRRVDKEKSKEKIDGIQALIMAVSRASLYTDSTKSIYDTREILAI